MTAPRTCGSRRAGARSWRAGALLLLGAWLCSGCAAQMRKTETRLDQIAADTQALRAQQSALAGDVAQVRSLLDSSGLVSDEQRAELLTRLRALEQAVEMLGARGQEQEALLRRISAALDQLTRRPGGPEVPPAAGGDADTDAKAPAPAPATAAPGTRQAAGTTPAGSTPAAPPASPSAGASGPAGDGSTEMVVFDAAMRDFTRGSYALARDGFQEVIRRFPRSELADNAAYWLGETFYAEGNYNEALARFDEVLRAYPGGDILPSALLKQGYCQLELGDRAAAIAAFQRLRREYPSSDEAAIAEHKLNAIGSSP